MNPRATKLAESRRAKYALNLCICRQMGVNDVIPELLD
jgi:hypothetical protein